MNNKSWEILKRILEHYKHQVGCKDCGCQKGLLDFDHEGTEKAKEFQLSHGVYFTPDQVWAEFDKCEVRCRPCHTSRHKVGNIARLGRKASKENIANCVKAQNQPEVRAKKSAAMRGSKHSAESKVNRSVSLKAAQNRLEVRAKKSLAMKAFWERKRQSTIP